MRPSWDEYFLHLAEAVALRADCRRRAVGAVLVSPQHRVLATGYNGTGAGEVGCLEGGCGRGLMTYAEAPEFVAYDDPRSPGYCISTHAELNAMLSAPGARTGSTMYVTCSPCHGCAKMLRNAKITVVYPA